MPDLTTLRLDLADHSTAGRLATLKKAAAGFESHFLKTLMSQVEEPVMDDQPLLGDDPGSQQFRDLLHGALADRGAGNLGLARMVVDQLAPRAGLTPSKEAPHERDPRKPVGHLGGPARP